MRRISALIIALSLIVLAGTAQAADRTVIFVLFDGFAPPTIDAAETPALDRIKQEGAWSHDLVPAFPTISATNHVTYTTGCWPGDHGMVSNYFYDNEKGHFTGSKDADWRTGCERIWETVERAGKPAATAPANR